MKVSSPCLPSDISLKTHSGEQLKVIGEVTVVVEYDSQVRQSLPLRCVKDRVHVADRD